jgi:protein-disulfide isomerase
VRFRKSNSQRRNYLADFIAAKGITMNKRDEQRRRREEKQRAAEKSQGTRKLLSRFGLFFVLPVIALITVYTLLNQAPTYSPVQVAENDHLRGNRDAPVTIVVYADFQCPACATEHETMMRLWPEKMPT